MKTSQRQQRWWWLAIAMTALALGAHADNSCLESPSTNDVNCSEGALVPNYVLAPTNITTMVGQPIRLPTVSNLAMTAGTETYSVSNPCSSVVYYGITSPINYTFGNLYFDPVMPPVFWSPGTYTYKAKVDIYGSMCCPVTHTNLGTVTVNVGTNNVFSDLLINVDFDVVTTKAGWAAIGQSSTDYWNPCNNGYWQSLTNMRAADGTYSGVGLTVTNAPGGWSNGAADPMYYAFIYASGQNVTITVTNLPTGRYDFYLYGHSQIVNDNGIYTISSAGHSYGPLGTATNGMDWLSPIWQEGQQYVVLRDVIVTNNQPVILTVWPSSYGSAIISGMQILGKIPIPLTPPAIVSQPASQTVALGGNVTFGVTATSTAPLLYQWCYSLWNTAGLTAIANATNATLTLTNVQASDVGNYFVIVSNSCGSVTSSNAALVLLGPSRLGYWNFDNTNTWVGDAGQLPLVASNVVGIASWSTNAALLDSANAAILSYRDVETNGSANIEVGNGTVRFWFRPDWSSITTNNGAGPQSAGRFIELGSCGADWWAMVVNSSGTQLSFVTETNGIIMTNVSVSINWLWHQWHQVVLAYTPTNSAIYLDGVQTGTNGMGVIFWPAAAVRGQGFRVGSDATGGQQVKGAVDELETFNYPLCDSDIALNYQAVMAIDTDGDGVPDLNELAQGTDPRNPNDSPGVLEQIQGRRPGTGIVVDTANQIDLRVYTPLR